MTILITGVAGFVGSHLVDYILREHPTAKIIGLKFAESPLDALSGTIDKVRFFDGDLLDVDFVDRVTRQVRPDKIFHLAALSAVQDSWKSSSMTFSNNIIG